MKKLMKLSGAMALNKIEQKNIFGGMLKKGRGCCDPALACCTTWDLVGTSGCPADGYSNPNCQFAYAVGNSYTDCCI